jgi:hypothetical protein
MSKVETDIVRQALETTKGIAPKQREEVLRKLKEQIEQEAAEKEEKAPAVKKEFVIIVSDPKGALKAYSDGVVGWVVQIEEGEAPQTALEKLHAACYDHNAGHGKKMPIQTIGEACETLKPKETKEHKLWIKTKEAVLVISTDNKLPSN